MRKDPAISAIDDFPDKLPLFLKSLVLPAIAATAGSVATAKGVKEWYPKLEKPSFNPPGAVFGPVWTVLYILMCIADYIVAAEGRDRDEKTNARKIYKIQLGLNSVWSILFFGFRRPGMALIEIGALWVSIVMTIASFWKISRTAALLLIPYLAWTTFAIALNAAIWWKNR
jgi:translocator protein